MPQLLPESPAAWELITLGVLPKHSLPALWTGRCRLWEARVFQPHLLGSLMTVLGHVLSRCKTTGPKDRGEGSRCPRQLYCPNPLHKLIPFSINEVKKGAIPRGQETPTDSSWDERLDDCQYCQVLSVSWVQRNHFCLSEKDLKAVQQNGHHQKTTKSELHLPSSSFYCRQAF